MNTYNRYDPTKNYERHLFQADRVLQSAELNELQSNLIDRVANVGNVLFSDGALMRDAGCVVDGITGETKLQSGALWLDGAVRGIGPATFTIPVVGSVVIGVYLQETTVTELGDPALLNPAVGTRGYMEPGAHRQQLTPVWGVAGDGKTGKFYPVYEAVDGVLKAKEAPPTIDAVSVALQKYDRDSTGGAYIIEGMQVRKGAEFAGDKQTYVVSAGKARVNGRQVELRAASRYVFTAAPDLKAIEREPHASTGTAAQRVNVDYGPIAELTEVAITAEKTVTLTHGAVSGGLDPLPDTSVLKIIEVKQGGTTYTKDTDYKFTAGKVDWSPNGAEPATGSTYTVKYQYLTTATPTDADSTGFTVAGAVADTLILVDYSYKVQRVDRLCINEAGDLVMLKGVASDWMPPPPGVPADMLLLATVYQKWGTDTTMSADSPRMVPMSDLAHVQDQLDGLKLLIAQQALQTDVGNRETALKKGMFVDPLLNDSMRDAGTYQTGAIVGGALTLPVSVGAAHFDADVAGPTTLAYEVVPLIQQNRRTGSMPVNAYQSFAPMPAEVTLDPAVDQMTYPVEMWTGALTSRVVQRVAYGASAGPASTESVETVSSTRTQDQVIRPVTVTFTISGFAAGETVESVSFDGVAVLPGTLTDPETRPMADAQGKATGKFNIPANVPVGRKHVQFAGSGGSYGGTYYTAASWTEDRVLRRVVTEYAYEYDPPPPPPPRPNPPTTDSGGDATYIPPTTGPVPKPVTSSGDVIRDAVKELYVKYLGREGEAAGVDWWTNEIKTSPTQDKAWVEHFLAAASGVDKPAAAAGVALWESAKTTMKDCVIDPLAQTFVTPEPAHLVGVDLWFESVGPTDIIVQLRAVSNGLPTRTLLAEARLAPSEIALPSGGTHSHTRALFKLPYYATAGEELAYVVMCNDAQTSLSIAELGKWDGAAWVTAQPYTIGTLLSSSNNSTWTAHQDRDLRFRPLVAKYTEAVRTVELGKVPVTGATDLMVLGLEEKPGQHSAISYTLTLPDGSEIAAASNQSLTLPAAVTGDIVLKARLRGDAVASPVLHRGGQLLVGWLGTNGDYVTRAIPAGTNSRVRVVVDALLPSGSTLAVQLKGTDQGDAWSASIPQLDSKALDNGLHELTFEQSGINEAMVQAKLVLTGTAAARPFVHKVRMVAM